MSYANGFGATGDGKTDDTGALQHAVNDGDGVLELSRGTYRITRPIVLDTRKRGLLGVRGDQGTARIVMAGAGPALQILGDHQGTASPGSFEQQTWDRQRMPIVSGLEILGEHPQADGIQLSRTMQATVQNVLIRRCRYGVHLVERNRNFLLNASHIYDCHDTGVYFDACNLHQVILSANHISYCKRAGIRQFNGDVHNIQITGNDIEYNSGYAGDDANISGEIVLQAPQGIISEYTIAGNTIQATLGAAGANVLILGKADEPPTSVRLVCITGNVLGSRECNLHIQHASRMTITGNTIYGGQRLGCDLRHSQHIVLSSNSCVSRSAVDAEATADGIQLEHCNACSVTGNILSDCHLGSTESGGAITIRNSRNISVSNCQVFNSCYRAIDVSGSRRCGITNNSIGQDTSDPDDDKGIRVDESSAKVIVQGNIEFTETKS